MPIPDDELDIRLNGPSPEFKTQGWHGHIAQKTFRVTGDPDIDAANCRVPSFEAEAEDY